jgi:acetyltransferase-like isoleucine patch superfamily enzyme
MSIAVRLRTHDQTIQELLALLPSGGRAGRIRSRYLQTVVRQCGPGLRVSQHVILKRPENLIIGADVFMNRGVFIAAHAPVSIGDGVLIGPYTIINSGDHRYRDGTHRVAEQGRAAQPILIGNDVWIAAHCTILKGVVLGEGCVVGAGAVVTHDVEPYAVVAGVPARRISERALSALPSLTP